MDFNDVYPNIPSVLYDDGCIVSFRNFVLIGKIKKDEKETGGRKKSKCVTVISINVCT